MLERAPTRPSIIEAMAADFYADLFRGAEDTESWNNLYPHERARFVRAMVEAVKRVPNCRNVGSRHGTATIALAEGREAILAEHQASQR